MRLWRTLDIRAVEITGRRIGGTRYRPTFPAGSWRTKRSGASPQTAPVAPAGATMRSPIAAATPSFHPAGRQGLGTPPASRHLEPQRARAGRTIPAARFGDNGAGSAAKAAPRRRCRARNRRSDRLPRARHIRRRGRGADPSGQRRTAPRAGLRNRGRLTAAGADRARPGSAPIRGWGRHGPPAAGSWRPGSRLARRPR